MIIRLLSYSKEGAQTAEKTAEALRTAGHDCTCYALPKYCLPGTVPLYGGSVRFAEDSFKEADGLIFVCAAGIAVRAIAPFVKSKKEDPAVIVMDELGKYAVPILSGHLGGANELAEAIAEGTGAVPVLTTGTDLHGKFAVDVFAKKNHLAIESMALAKDISAAVLSGEPVGFVCDFPVKGGIPAEINFPDAPLGICISSDRSKNPFQKTLRLIPKRYAAGLGCRKDKDTAELEAFFLKKVREAGIDVSELRVIASIDLKKEEAALLALSEKYRLPFVTFTAEELSAVPGEFTASGFVRQVTGVDSVCERAAAAVTDGGEIIVKKQAEDGCTFALAEYKEEIDFG